jgi:hypothetical protein
LNLLDSAISSVSISPIISKGLLNVGFRTVSSPIPLGYNALAMLPKVILLVLVWVVVDAL